MKKRMFSVGRLPYTGDEDLRNKSEEGCEWMGHHLFVIGFTDNPENCVSDIYRMGDKHFEAKAQGYDI